MAKIRVLRVCPNVNVGLGHNLRPFIKGMKEAGIKQDILSEGIDFSSRPPFSAFRAGFEAAKKTKLGDYDYVHTHNPSFWGLLLKAKGKVPSIITFHGSYYYTLKYFYIGNIKENLHYLINGLLSILLADSVIFINKKDQSFFSHFTKKCFFIPPGYDDSIFNIPQKGKEKNQTARKNQVIFVGRDNPNKNFRAIESFCKKNNLPLLAVHGDSKYSSKELAKLYSSSKYIALFSYTEGFGKVLLEAIACGCIPIVSKTVRTNLSELGISYLTPNEFGKADAHSKSFDNNKTNIKKCTWERVCSSTYNFYLMRAGSFFNSKQKVLIVEPHNDDALLSMGGIILSNPKTQFTILSIVSNNGVGSSKLHNSISNVTSIQLNLKGVHNGEPEDVFFSRNKLNLAEFSQIIREYSIPFDAVILPKGIYHPLHKLVGKINLYNSYHYLDLPYGIPKLSSPGPSLLKLFFKRKFKFNVTPFLKRKMDLAEKNYDSSVKEYVKNGPGRRIKNFIYEILFY